VKNKTFLFVLISFLLFATMPNFSLAEERKILPISAGEYTDAKIFKITNKGNQPIYKLEMWTLPPNSSLWQRVTQCASFKKHIGTLEANTYINIPFNELINDDGKRLDDSYVIGSVKFEGSYEGETLYTHIGWQ